MEVQQAFSMVIVRERTTRGLTQERVAERGGMDLTFLRDLEKARSQPSLTTIFRIAKGLGVEPHTLILSTEEILAQSQPDAK